MTDLMPSLSLNAMNVLLFIFILNLVPLSIWAVWDLEQRWRSWLSRRQAKHAARRRPSRPQTHPRTNALDQ